MGYVFISTAETGRDGRWCAAGSGGAPARARVGPVVPLLQWLVSPGSGMDARPATRSAVAGIRSIATRNFMSLKLPLGRAQCSLSRTVPKVGFRVGVDHRSTDCIGSAALVRACPKQSVGGRVRGKLSHDADGMSRTSSSKVLQSAA